MIAAAAAAVLGGPLLPLLPASAAAAQAGKQGDEIDKVDEEENEEGKCFSFVVLIFRSDAMNCKC